MSYYKKSLFQVFIRNKMETNSTSTTFSAEEFDGVMKYLGN